MGLVEGLMMKRGIAIAAEAPARVHHDSDESKLSLKRLSALLQTHLQSVHPKDENALKMILISYATEGFGEGW